jgi:hypothetical protein
MALPSPQQSPVTLTIVELQTEATVSLFHQAETAELVVSSGTHPLRCVLEDERLVVTEHRQGHSISDWLTCLVAATICACMLQRAPVEQFQGNTPLNVVVRWYISYTVFRYLVGWCMKHLVQLMAHWFSYTYRFRVLLVALEEIHLGSRGLLIADRTLMSPNIEVRSCGGSLIFGSSSRQLRQFDGVNDLGELKTVRFNLSGPAIINGQGLVVPQVMVITRGGTGSLIGFTATQHFSVIPRGWPPRPFNIAVQCGPECNKQQL